MRPQTFALALGGLLLAGVALAGEAAVASLPDVVKDEGFKAADDALRATIAANPKDKKRDAALAAAKLAAVTMPVVLEGGAELTLKDPSPVGGCAWTGSLACGFAASAPEGTKPEDFAATCRIPFGGSSRLTLKPAAGQDGRLAWTIPDVEDCWKLDGTAVVVRPVALGDLDGHGAGDDNIPPEIIELSQDQVEQTIRDHQGAFQYCQKKLGSTASGKFKVQYAIAADGSVGSAVVVDDSYQDAAVEQCVLEQFQRMRFPPPNGGFDHGTWPLAFMN